MAIEGMENSMENMLGTPVVNAWHNHRLHVIRTCVHPENRRLNPNKP